MKRKHFPKYNLQLSIWRNKTHISTKTIVHSRGEEITFIESHYGTRNYAKNVRCLISFDLHRLHFIFVLTTTLVDIPSLLSKHISLPKPTHPLASVPGRAVLPSTFALWHTWKSVTFARHTETDSRVFWSIQLKLDEKMYICMYKIL